MIHTMTEDGYFYWQCDLCKRQNREHISHDEMEYSTQTAYKELLSFGIAEEQARQKALSTVPPGTTNNVVNLPRCACGAQCSVRVSFTEGELAPPIIHRDSLGVIVQVELAKDALVDVRRRMERLPDGRHVSRIHEVVQHPAIATHQELSRQLDAIGKRPLDAAPGR